MSDIERTRKLLKAEGRIHGQTDRRTADGRRSFTFSEPTPQRGNQREANTGNLACGLSYNLITVLIYYTIILCN